MLPRIVLGVTSAGSLGLMAGLPERLVAEGWSVHIVSSPGPQLDMLASTPNISAHPVPMRRDPSPVEDLKSLIAWWHLLRALKPEVLFVGTPKAGFLAMLAGLGARIRVRIYHVRGLRLETASNLTRHVYSSIERLTFSAATSAVAVSRSLMDRVIFLGLCPARKITVLGRGSSNGVDVERFAPVDNDEDSGKLREQLGLAHGVPVIGFVGRLHPDKGIDILVDASRLLTEREVNHQLLVIGSSDHSGAEGLIQNLRSLDANVILVGSVPDTAPYYHLMDLHCLPTLREGFPNVVLEAAASGIPTVTTEATGAVDSVLPNETGAIVPVNDSSSLAAALGKLLIDDGRRSSQASKARRYTTSTFARSAVHARVLEHLNEARVGAQSMRGRKR